MAEIVSKYEFNARVLQELQPGDRIQFPRGLFYCHWAIYLGNEEVAHVAGVENDGVNGAAGLSSLFAFSGVKSSGAKVRVDNFWTVVDKSRAFKNNDRDSIKSPLSREEIVRRARERLSETGYDIFNWNCEHFVNWCRYGDDDAVSDQADALKQVLTEVMKTWLEMYQNYKKKKENK